MYCQRCFSNPLIAVSKCIAAVTTPIAKTILCQSFIFIALNLKMINNNYNNLTLEFTVPLYPPKSMVICQLPELGIANLIGD